MFASFSELTPVDWAWGLTFTGLLPLGVKGVFAATQGRWKMVVAGTWACMPAAAPAFGLAFIALPYAVLLTVVVLLRDRTARGRVGVFVDHDK